MRFTLTYDGPLPSNGNATKKAQIRAALRPQLAALWSLEPLMYKRKHLTLTPEAGGHPALETQIDGAVFAPLVCELFKLVAELDVLLLRPKGPGALITHGGDIDNQLKTLFDALRTPGSPQEMGDMRSEGTEEDPFFTLLEDDRLVTRVNVDSDRLLSYTDPEQVRVVIRVTTRARFGTWGFFDLGS